MGLEERLDDVSSVLSDRLQQKSLRVSAFVLLPDSSLGQVGPYYGTRMLSREPRPPAALHLAAACEMSRARLKYDAFHAACVLVMVTT